MRWVVDPLDGTTNFLFGIPQFCVSVAAEVGRQTAVGVVVDPSRGETWAVVRGGGPGATEPCAGLPRIGRPSLPPWWRPALVTSRRGVNGRPRLWPG